MYFLKTLFLTTLFLSLTFLPVHAQNGGSQFSLTLDELWQGAFQKSSNDLDSGMGGSIFFDWRPTSFLSLNVGSEYSNFFNSSLRLSTFDLGGRLFPFPSFGIGELYLQGGLGRNFFLTPAGHYHGFAGLGWRQFLSEDMALDLGVQYDYFSPYSASVNAASVKLGLVFLFGRKESPLSTIGSNLRPTTIVLGTNWKGESYYIWKEGDNLQALAYAVYGDPNLFTVILKANENLFYRDGFSPGTRLVIPAMPQKKILYNPTEGGGMVEKGFTTHNPPIRYYLWKPGDNLPAVAQKLYGDEDMYPLLVDANELDLGDPSNLVYGKIIKVPNLPSVDQLDQIRLESQNDPHYLWWRNASGGK